MSIARFRHVAMPQFEQGNRSSIAWCKRPNRPRGHRTFLLALALFDSAALTFVGRDRLVLLFFFRGSASI